MIIQRPQTWLLGLILQIVVTTAATVANHSETETTSACWRDSTCDGPTKPAFPGPWESNMYSPEERSVHPSTVASLSLNDTSLYKSDSAVVLTPESPGIVFDFGFEVGGTVAFDYTVSETEGRCTNNDSLTLQVGLSFSESRTYIGRRGDNSLADSTGDPGDGALAAALTAKGRYNMPDRNMRGGFRYFTLFLDGVHSGEGKRVEISNVIVELSFQPTWPNLRAYQGYFHSDDDLINKIWYSGAYTIQTNSAPGSSGRNDPPAKHHDWRNDAFITAGSTVLLDGAKRDRWVWIGDMGTAVPSAFVSTGDLESTKWALLGVYQNPNVTGMLPKSAPPYVRWDSDSYHMWALIGMYNYYLYSGDEETVRSQWSTHEAAVQYALSLIDEESGIVIVRGERDWGRLTNAKDRSSASMLLYRALIDTASMADWLSDNSAGSGSYRGARYYKAEAAKLRKAIFKQFWDGEAGAFRESRDPESYFPQDANSYALAYGVLERDSQRAKAVSEFLTTLWTPIGPSSPELPGNISPFTSSVELHAHFRAGRPDRALGLMRALWGWYLEHPDGTQSTTPEGFLTNGTWGYRFNGGYRNAPSYTSHAHCWSSGPTSTLSEYMVGLRLTRPGGASWLLMPATFKELGSAQAGYTTHLGKFSASFEVRKEYVIVWWDTEGVVELPGGKKEKVPGGQGKRIVKKSLS